MRTIALKSRRRAVDFRGEGRIPMRFVVTLLAAACLSFSTGCMVTYHTGTEEVSRTLQRPSERIELSSVAVLAVPYAAASEGLTEGIEESLVHSLRRSFPKARVLSPEQFAQSLARHKGYLNHFTNWRAAYTQNRYLDPRPLANYGKAAQVRYLLNVRGVHIDREELTQTGIRWSGCCFFRNGARFWETNLAVPAELIDTQTGKVVWRGRGVASNMNEGGSTMDHGVVVFHIEQTDVSELAGPMAAVAADGIVRELGGKPRPALAYRVGTQ